VIILIVFSIGLTDFTIYRYLKPNIKRLRPSHTLEKSKVLNQNQIFSLSNIRILTGRGGKWSMPSNHAANSFAFAMILALFYKRYRMWYFFIAFLVGYSRVYVVKHYPFDIIIGMIYGIAIALLFYYFWLMIRTRLENQ